MDSKVFGDNPVLFGQSVYTIIGLAHSSDGAANGVGLVGAGHATRGLVHIRDVDLDGSVILGPDDSVTGRAEIGNNNDSIWVTFKELPIKVNDLSDPDEKLNFTTISPLRGPHRVGYSTS